MDKKRYSSVATTAVAQFLLRNGIKFIHTRSLQSNRMRIYYYATDEQAETLEEETRIRAIGEVDGWGFDNWELLK